MRCAAICFLLDFGWGRRKLPASAEARGEGPTASQLKSNRMMQQRIFFQALAITVVVLLLFMAGRT